MRGLLGVVVLCLAAACGTAREQCAATCKGCCDPRGVCQLGTDGYACGVGQCDACLVGQACMAGCSGAVQASQLRLTSARFANGSAQGFFNKDGLPFIVLSDLKRTQCRDPNGEVDPGEVVLLISTPTITEREPLVLLTQGDGGVARRVLAGQANLSFNTTRVTATMRVTTTGEELEGSLDVPTCGVLR